MFYHHYVVIVSEENVTRMINVIREVFKNKPVVDAANVSTKYHPNQWRLTFYGKKNDYRAFVRTVSDFANIYKDAITNDIRVEI